MAQGSFVDATTTTDVSCAFASSLFQPSFKSSKQPMARRVVNRNPNYQ
jgi:hypothetical protein